VGPLLALLTTEAYASGEGFEFMIVEQDIGDCLDRPQIKLKFRRVQYDYVLSGSNQGL
jgi:hypothetical protein